jgi:purine-binding chemotaxis protein CheW
MTTADVLDDYLGELLMAVMPQSNVPPAQVSAVAAPNAENASAAPGVAATEAPHSIAVEPSETSAGKCDARLTAPSPPPLPHEAPSPTQQRTPSAPAGDAPETLLTASPTAAGDEAPPRITAAANPHKPASGQGTSPAHPAKAAIARPQPAPSAQVNAWQELQRQARQRDTEHDPRRSRSEPTTRWLRLRCGGQSYALELLKVQEVVLPVPLLALRGTGQSMLGIMNLRGQVVPVIDLGLHLGAQAIDMDAHTRIVVLEENGDTMGLRVSAVDDVASLSDSQIEPPDTARICQISNDLFRGVARLGLQPMILLDASKLLH